MTDDVRISVALRNHRKTKRLRKRLGAEACWSLVCLFLFAGEQRWTGDLSGMSVEDIEDEADWQGEPGEFVSALVELRFLDVIDGDYSIHDWEEHNPFAATKGRRIEKGKRAAEARWNKRVDAPSMQRACNEHAASSAEQCPPAPTPTQPSTTTDRSLARAGETPDAPKAELVGTFEGHGPVQPITPEVRTRIEVIAELRRANLPGVLPGNSADLLAYVREGGSANHIRDVIASPDCAGKAAGYALKCARTDLSKQPGATPLARAGPGSGQSKVVTGLQDVQGVIDAIQSERRTAGASAEGRTSVVAGPAAAGSSEARVTLVAGPNAGR